MEPWYLEELYEGKDNVIRAAKLLLIKIYIEQPIQFLYPLELNCDTWKRQKKMVHQCSKQSLNINASEFKPLMNAAEIVEVRIRDGAESNKDELCSSLFDLFPQIWEKRRKLGVINIHRKYCTWEKETIS